MSTDSPAVLALFRLRSHYRWTTAILLGVAALALLGYACLQVFFEYRYQRTQQRNDTERVHKAVTQALSSATLHVQGMRSLAEAHWSGELSRTVPTEPLRPYEGLAPADAPWDQLPEAMAQKYGGLFLDPTVGDTPDKLNAFKKLALATMPVVAARHQEHGYFQWSYIYDAQGSVSALYPAVSRAQYLDMTQSADMATAQNKVFAAGGTHPVRLAGPSNNPDRGLVWTQPYRDAGGKGMMVTLLAPVYDADRLVAVVGTDITLSLFDDILKANPVSQSQLWVVDASGGVLAASHDRLHHQQRLNLSDVQPERAAHRQAGIPLPGAAWSLVTDSPSGALVLASLARSQASLAIALALVCLMALLLRWQRQSVVGPALRLVQFVQDVAVQPEQAVPPVPQLWRDCFSRVSASARERQTLLDAMTRKSEELELRVHERTQELTALNQGLVRAKAQAEAASAAKSAFLANMSHEIRTPIHAIAGMTYLLAEADLSPKQKEYVDEVVKANKHLLRLLNAVLDLAKIEAGKLELDSAPFDLDHVLGNVRSLFAQKMRQKGLTFDVQRMDNGPFVLMGDALRLTQILVNLVNNAGKFTDTGSVHVRAFTQQSEWGKAHVRLQVSDTGIGMSQRQIDRLFQPFEQAEPSISRRFGGTGLGLTIVKAFVDAMGGRIEVKSAPRRGTVFSIELTLAVHAEPFNQAATAPMPLDALAGFQGKRVLLAEDNLVNQRIAQEILLRENLRVDLACDGEEALQRCRAHRYDLVLMDVQMPNMDGLQATRLIRQLGVDTPIIAMTANTTLQDRSECLQAGMTDFLGKPFSAVVFVKMVKKWLSDHPELPPDVGQAPSKYSISA